MALNRGRYIRRHDSVLHHIYSTIIEQKPDNLEIFVDLSTSTDPRFPLIFWPDIVILNRAEKKIFLLELTCSLEQNSNTANACKTTKYTPLKADLEAQYVQGGTFQMRTEIKAYSALKLSLTWSWGWAWQLYCYLWK